MQEENPYLHLGSEIPKGSVEVSYDKGLNFDNRTEGMVFGKDWLH